MGPRYLMNGHGICTAKRVIVGSDAPGGTPQHVARSARVRRAPLGTMRQPAAEDARCLVVRAAMLGLGCVSIRQRFP